MCTMFDSIYIHRSSNKKNVKQFNIINDTDLSYLLRNISRTTSFNTSYDITLLICFSLIAFNNFVIIKIHLQFAKFIEIIFFYRIKVIFYSRYRLIKRFTCQFFEDFILDNFSDIIFHVHQNLLIISALMLTACIAILHYDRTLTFC